MQFSRVHGAGGDARWGREVRRRSGQCAKKALPDKHPAALLASPGVLLHVRRSWGSLCPRLPISTRTKPPTGHLEGTGVFFNAGKGAQVASHDNDAEHRTVSLGAGGECRGERRAPPPLVSLTLKKFEPPCPPLETTFWPFAVVVCCPSSVRTPSRSPEREGGGRVGARPCPWPGCGFLLFSGPGHRFCVK